MHIVVCIKQTPDPEMAPSQFRVDEEAGTAIPWPGSSLVPSPFDEQAVEAALRIRDTLGEARITLVCLGPEQARATLKAGLALGADQGVLLSDAAFEGGDGATTAVVLARAIAKLAPFDLILAGRQAADTDAGVVGCGVAELLDLAAVTLAKDVAVEDGGARVVRALADGTETVEAPLPLVVTVSHELGAPRHASLRETMRAAKKPIEAWSASDLDLQPAEVGRAGARCVVERLFVPASDVTCEFVEGATARDQAAALVERLRAAEVL
ncbi:MAG: electron transfer flavoprotein subunit beta/FixA family protein [Rhodospirillales bacterium]|nr:electron transfer flavoprotein subunit beta/FixA family protein [Rhodospirillales bacterium]